MTTTEKVNPFNLMDTYNTSYSPVSGSQVETTGTKSFNKEFKKVTENESKNSKETTIESQQAREKQNTKQEGNIRLALEKREGKNSHTIKESQIQQAEIEKITRNIKENSQIKELKQENVNINFLNHFSKEIAQINHVKIKKVFAHNNLLEQYQAFRERITHHVGNSIRFLISSGESRAAIQLYPPELGRVQVDLIVHDHQVTVKINTENAAVKEIILANLDQLKSNLANVGTQISKFEVEVGGFKNHFEQYFSKGESRNGRHHSNTTNGLSQDRTELNPDEVRNQQAINYFLGRRINYLI